jgi:hypothetical protein
MPLQIDEVNAELVAPPKPEQAARSQGSKAGPDLRGQFELLQQRQKRLRAD